MRQPTYNLFSAHMLTLHSVPQHLRYTITPTAFSAWTYAETDSLWQIIKRYHCTASAWYRAKIRKTRLLINTLNAFCLQAIMLQSLWFGVFTQGILSIQWVIYCTHLGSGDWTDLTRPGHTSPADRIQQRAKWTPWSHVVRILFATCDHADYL